MKKILFVLMLSIFITLATVKSASALNFYYRIYNPNINQTDNKAELIYIKVTSNEYQIGFGSKFGACVMTEMTKANNLWKGSCADVNNGQVYKWSEVMLNNLDREVESLVKELSEQGLKPYQP